MGSVTSRVDAALRRSPAQRVFNRRSAQRLTVLAYHGIDDARTFATQLDYLTRHFTPVTLESLVAARQGNGTLPRSPALITFDDGCPSLFERGLPLLADRRVPAVAFVVAGAVAGEVQLWFDEVPALVLAGGTSQRTPEREPDSVVRFLKTLDDDERLEAIADLRATARPRPPRQTHLSADNLREMEAAGVAIGSHSWSHPCLDTCTPEKVRAELSSADEYLHEVLGHRPLAFAYPNGNWSHDVRAAVDAAGYDVAFVFDHRVSALPPRDWLAVSRVRVNSTTTIDRFATIVNGLHPAIHHLRRRG